MIDKRSRVVTGNPLPEKGVLSAQEHRSQVRRAVLASTIGTTIEWYDFFLYGIATGLVFARLFFPSSSPLVGTLQAFAIYFAAFVSRPLGAALFGHYGDRLGRKTTLIATLLVMGLATFLIGLLPTYAQIGTSAALILAVLRFLQGVGVGGEWGGSVLVAMEWARTPSHRGFIASWPQLGVPLGLLLANAVVLFSSQFSGQAFLSWGWRVPFWLSAALIGIGLYIRVRVLETPQFRILVAERRLEKRPVLVVLRKHLREVLLAALARVGEQAPSYVFSTFVYSYATTMLGVSRDFLLGWQLIGSLIACIATPFFGFVSDRVGRRRTYLIGIVSTAIFGFAYFSLLETRSPVLVCVALISSSIPPSIMYGPQAALIAETFPSRVRYSGASLAYHLASVLAGGTTPLIATTLIVHYHTGTAVAFYVLACAAVSFVATLFLKDRTNQRIDDSDYAAS